MEKIISYEKFKNYMTVLKKTLSICDRVNKDFMELSPDFGGFYLGDIEVEYVNMLRELTNDKYDDISYYIYELNWGKDWHKGMMTDENNNDIRMSTIEDLYNYLKENFND